MRQLAYEFAEKNKLDHRFNREKEIAGKEWLRGFRKRNIDISLRRPKPTSQQPGHELLTSLKFQNFLRF